MGLLTSYFLVCAYAAVVSSMLASQRIELRCQNALCVDIDGKEFTVEGHNITIDYSQTDGKLAINCHGWQALDSVNMPNFTNTLLVFSVKLEECPPPSRRSFVNALASLNLIFTRRDHGPYTSHERIPINPKKSDDTMELELKNLPIEPQLNARHFVDLEFLTGLNISSPLHATSTPTVAAGFLSELMVLRWLAVYAVRLPDGELNRLPPTLNFIDHNSRYGYGPSPTVGMFQLTFWNEIRVEALNRCERLRKLVLWEPIAAELPERWVAACPNLEELRVSAAKNLHSLPAKLLENASSLKKLSFDSCNISVLPAGWLEGAPNLMELDLSHNNFLTVSSAEFLGPKLLSLDLSYSRSLLEKEVLLNALAPLTSLTTLDLSYLFYSDFCTQNGYSPLRNLTRLRRLNLHRNKITRICRDWREDMTFLNTLTLTSSRILKLEYDDFQYIRDTTVKDAKVILGEVESKFSVIFTEEDYMKALTAPATGATVEIIWPIYYNPCRDEDDYDDRDDDDISSCGNCTIYWTWKVMVNANHTMKLSYNIPVNGHGYFNQLSEKDVCPERASNIL